MHKASMKSSRLINVLRILVDGRPHESYELAYKAKQAAISATISELRANGIDIRCYRRNGRYHYQLMHPLVPCSIDTFLRNVELNLN